MNIYVDETFFEDRTIVAAVKISDKKIIEALFLVKRINDWSHQKKIKATDIRMVNRGQKGKINSTIRAINKKSKWATSKSFVGKQHSQEFLAGYKSFLEEMHAKCPTATIYVDKFGGCEKITLPYVIFAKQDENPGIQISDIFLVDKRK